MFLALKIQVSNQVTMPHVKAVIWDFYKVSEPTCINPRFGVRQVCKNDVSRGGSTLKTYNTSNLISHQKREHPLDFKDYEEKKIVQELKKKESTEKNTSKDRMKQLPTGRNRGKGKTMEHQ